MDSDVFTENVDEEMNWVEWMRSIFYSKNLTNCFFYEKRQKGQRTITKQAKNKLHGYGSSNRISMPMLWK